MHKQMEKFVFAQCVNFKTIELFETNGTNYLFFFGDSYEEICISKVIVYTAAAG